MTKQEKIRKRLKAIKKEVSDLEDEQQEYYRYEEIEWEIYRLNNEAEDLGEKLMKLKSKPKSK